jgi:hypothetical protein
MTEIELSENSIDAIARRVIELLESTWRHTRAWVYEHASELRAIRLGRGPSPRMRWQWYGT